MQYWINQNGVQAGPVTEQELKNMQITPQAYVWRNGLADWVKITQLPELAFLFAENDGNTIDAPATETVAADNAIADTAESQPEATQQEAELEVPTTDHISEPEPAVETEESASTDEVAAEPQENNAQTLPPPTPEQQAQATTAYDEPQYSTWVDDEQPAEQTQQGEYYQPQQAYQPEQDAPKCPPTNMAWAIAFTILCCNPLGIIAIFLAAKVSKKYYEGDYAAAERYSEWSAWGVILTIVTGIILSIITSILPSLFMSLIQ